MISNHPFAKTFLSYFISILLFSTHIFAKSVTIHITVKNFAGSIDIYDPELQYDLTKKKVTELHLDAHQSTSYSLDINQPTYLILYLESDKLFNYNLFLSPGDDLFLTADFSKKNSNVIVTGKGSNNNQPEIFALTNMDTQPFKGDTTPYRVVTALNTQYLVNKALLANYIKVNKPSAAFIRTAMFNLQYFVPANYYEFSHNNNFGKSKVQLRKWQKHQDSIFSTIKLSNDDALTAYNYAHLIDNFLLRETDVLWKEYQIDPALFFKEWLHSNPDQNKKPLSSMQAGALNEMVINKYFKGKTAEYGYAQTIKYEFSKADYPSTVSLFDDFKKKYPASKYIKGFSAPMAEVINKQRRVPNSKIVFFKDNGANLNKFEDVLTLTKGKTVFIDMWGTWCGPCREEIEKNSAQLRTHFKGKDVIFLYIDNHDTGREAEWKQQIAYFQMEGQHIFANPKLTEDIMKKVKATGYPTYIIVKKDGSYKQTLTRYPVNLQALVKEIEAASS